MQDNVIFTGYVPDELKTSVYYLADIYVMISREVNGDTEGFGITYLEANLCGLPVIAGNSGGVSDAVEDNVNGLLVQPDDILLLQEYVTRLIKLKAERERLSVSGKNRIEMNLTWKKIAEKLINQI